MTVLPLQAIFREFDLDRSGSMSSYEMRLALDNGGNSSLTPLLFVACFCVDLQRLSPPGFKLNNRLYQMLVARYADNETIDFDNFTCCLIKLEAMFSTFTHTCC